MTSKTRVRRAKKVVMSYNPDDVMETNTIDLLADLHHWAARYGELRPKAYLANLLRVAGDHYDVEQGHRGCNAG